MSTNIVMPYHTFAIFKDFISKKEGENKINLQPVRSGRGSYEIQEEEADTLKSGFRKNIIIIIIFEFV